MNSHAYLRLISTAVCAVALAACDSHAPTPTPEPAAAEGAPSGTPSADEATAAAAEATAAQAPTAPAPSDGGAAAALVPPEDCATPRPTVVHDAPTPGEPSGCEPHEIGGKGPLWALRDVQPQSCGAGAIYGLDAFHGHVTVVALLSATCGYCLAQAQKLEEMAATFEAMGQDVEFAIVNHAPTAEQAGALLERVSFPVFQDVAEVDAWGLLDGAKDDFFVYDTEGHLFSFLRASPDLDTNLSTPTGFVTLKNQVLAALGLPKEDTPPPTVLSGQNGQGQNGQGQGAEGQGGDGQGGQGQ
ncbi:MAG: hypothetical protein H6700_11115 [Myxococcales bacterium]|nr:hypothetical protein [Myxococcales bacterium]MCB9519862.1 hypothetical protein [Myxococcales bacterium]MCB9532306.1 hypothetical protein [Myxococcales bacterium]